MIVVLSAGAGSHHQEQLRELFGSSAFFEVDSTERSEAEAANNILERLTIWREAAMLKVRRAL
jgi:hypothetical protein